MSLNFLARLIAAWLTAIAILVDYYSDRTITIIFWMVACTATSFAVALYIHDRHS